MQFSCSNQGKPSLHEVLLVYCKGELPSWNRIKLEPSVPMKENHNATGHTYILHQGFSTFNNLKPIKNSEDHLSKYIHELTQNYKNDMDTLGCK